MSDELQKVAIFQKREVRRVFHENEWWFVINDVISVLTDSANPAQYLSNIRRRDEELAKLMSPVEKRGGSI